MPSESDLRDLLQGPDSEGRAAIDLDAVLTRARRRRRPKVVAAQALGSVALVGVLGTAIGFGIPQPNREAMIAEDAGITQESAGGSAGDAAPFLDEDETEKSSVLAAAACGSPVAEPSSGWSLTVAPVRAAAGSEPVPVEVVLRNDGRERIIGGTGSAPAVAVSRDGVVVAVASALDAVSWAVDLEPGASQGIPGAFVPVDCASGDTDPLAPGEYLLQPLVYLAWDGGHAGEVIVGTTSSLVLD